jgi:hypothetical protein
VREELTKQLPLKDRRNKTLPTNQPLGKTITELLLKYPYQDWILEE